MTSCVWLSKQKKGFQYGDLSGLLLEEVVINSADSKARHGKKGTIYRFLLMKAVYSVEETFASL